MAGNTTTSGALLIRSELWSNQLKETLLDNTMIGQKYVNWIPFPDGDTMTIPSIGELDAYNYAEDTAVQYTALDTGEFQFSINEYLSSATYITNKARQDLFYSSQLEAQFVPQQARAIMKRVETDIFKEGQPKTGNPAGYQVPANLNLINGAAHRWVGSDTMGAAGNRVLTVEDFSRARYGLKKANVPDSNLIAIVDPSTAVVLETHPNFINFSSINPRFEGIIETGMSSNMRFVKNIFGFDVYESNYLAKCGADQTGNSETIDGVASGTGALCNLFFSATSGILPYIGAWRQMPKVDAEYNKDFQREEYVTTARYGLKIQRPENLITVLSGNAIFG